MKIKKIGHCCLLITLPNLTILTDPGVFSVGQENITDIDVILITHEHADHLHTESLHKVLRNNPEAIVLTNSSVAKILDTQKIQYKILEQSDSLEIQNILIEAYEGKHEEIFENIGQVQNTGFFIDNKLFYPGDSFINPNKAVDILALPVAGPWCRIPDAIRYALNIKPKKAFPVHDGMLEENRVGASHAIPKKILEERHISFTEMLTGDEAEF